MPRDMWSEDPAQRSIALEERSRAVEADTTPTINALAPLVEEKPSGVLLRRVSDGWVILAEDAEAARLTASGEYRPLLADGNYSDNGALSCQADPEDIELARKERIAALARLRSGEAIERVLQDELTRLSELSDEELAGLSVEYQP